ncbi:ATP-binding cassette domain-containing protein [Micromonospora sp. NPDC049102]|uniref:ATP-binding cassette domain-containing protein n=1 Tax=Micromonospora sp. NPDC049102 TaxID=3364265 RepID=UPI00372064DD
MLLACEGATSVLSSCRPVSTPCGRDSIGNNNTQEPSGELSGGQWQRITAARGFLRDAELLIMDEPSSALDPRAEDALFQAIRDRKGRATTILITHRLANVRHADRIFVLHHGRLVEAGSHDDLIATGGRYAELFSLQAAGYDATPSEDSPIPQQHLPASR